MTSPDYNIEDPTAQDVIDAMRLTLTAQKDPAERLRLVETLLDLAPAYESNRGLALVRRMIVNGALKVAVVDA